MTKKKKKAKKKDTRKYEERFQRKADDQLVKFGVNRSQVNELQTDELEALENIYMQDFEMSEDKSLEFIRVYKVQCTSHPDDLNFIDRKSIKLCVSVPVNYPYESVYCNLEAAKNVGCRERDQILQEVRGEASSDENHGEVIVYKLCELVTEMLRCMCEAEKGEVKNTVDGDIDFRLTPTRMQSDRAFDTERYHRITIRDEDLLHMKFLREYEKEAPTKLTRRSRRSKIKPEESQSNKINIHKTGMLLVHLVRHFVEAYSEPDEAEDDFKAIVRELEELNVIPEHFKHREEDSDEKDNLLFNAASFSKKFKKDFEKSIIKADTLVPIISKFWARETHPSNKVTFPASPDIRPLRAGAAIVAQSSSRYVSDYEEIEDLGKGGFGEVMKCRNKLDGRYYAVKRIKIVERGSRLKRLLREVTTLSRIQGENILRYFTAWMEDADGDSPDFLNTYHGTGTGTFLTADLFAQESFSSKNLNSHSLVDGPMRDFLTRTMVSDTDSDSEEEKGEHGESSLHLYLVTGFCQQTLRDTINNMSQRTIRALSLGLEGSKEIDEINARTWKLFRQILDGLRSIHKLDIFHRDLKPTNIFLDFDGKIKIGDFGLATFSQRTSLPKEEVDIPEARILDVSIEQHTRGVGTYLYTAPEILSAKANSGSGTASSVQDAHYGREVDMYALGIIFFEMCFPFTTGHERIVTIQGLRQRQELPRLFSQTHRRQAKIITWLCDLEPTQRPTVDDLLKSELLPPKMEDEHINDLKQLLKNPGEEIYKDILNDFFVNARSLCSINNKLISKVSHSVPIERLNDHYKPVWQINYQKTYIRDFVTDNVQSRFELHSQTRVYPPIFEPVAKGDAASDGYPSRKILMSRTGELMTLRDECRRSFAAVVASDELQNSRVWSIQPVYRFVSTDSQRGVLDSDAIYPVAKEKGNFDILSNGSLADAEVIQICHEVLLQFKNEFCSSGGKYTCSYTVRIGHSKLNHLLLEIAGVSRDKFELVNEKLKDLGNQNFNTIRHDLYRHGLDKAVVDNVKRLFVTSPGILQKQVKDLQHVLNLQFSKSSSSALAEANRYCQYLKIDIWEKLKRWAVRPDSRQDLLYLVFEPALSHESYDGIVFRAIAEISCSNSTPYTLAYGGRYDKMLQDQSKRLNIQPSLPLYGVGVTINIDVLIDLHLKNRERTRENFRNQVNLKVDYLMKNPLIFVCMIDQQLTDFRDSVLGALWSAGLSSQTALSWISLYEQLQIATRLDAMFIIVLVSKSKLKLRTSRRTQEFEDINQIIKLLTRNDRGD